MRGEEPHRYQDNYPRTITPGQLPPDKYPPDNYPLGQIPPGHLPPPEKFFKHLPWYSLYLYSSYSFLLGRTKYPFYVSYHKPFCVLPNKQQATYNRLFEILKEHQNNLAPQNVMVDFELAVLNAITTSFPDSSKKGCFFHFSQAIFKKFNL